MRPVDARALVRQSYDRIGSRYRDWGRTIADPARERIVAHLESVIPPGSRAMDLGCADGSLSTRRLAQRFAVTGVDISSEQLQLARRQVPDAHFINADMTELHFPPAHFDIVSAFYCLTHLPREDVAGVLGRIASWLSPGGIFAASFGTADQAGNVAPDWLGVPMYFSGFTRDENIRLVEQAGLSILDDRVETHQEFDEPVSFHWIVAQNGETP